MPLRALPAAPLSAGDRTPAPVGTRSETHEASGAPGPVTPAPAGHRTDRSRAVDPSPRHAADRAEMRAAFLAGEGTMTVAEVQAWASELAPQRWPSGMAASEPLMVSVVRREPCDQRAMPRRDDAVAAWLKRMRDRWSATNPAQAARWQAVEDLLRRYCECADYGRSLDPDDRQGER